MKRYFFALFLIATITTAFASDINISGSRKEDSHNAFYSKVVFVPKNADLSLIMADSITNTHYVIRHKHNLSRYALGLTIGSNCILEFRKGNFNNGRIKCSNIIIGGRKPRFVNTYIEVENADNVQLNNVKASYSFAIDDFVKISNSRNISLKSVKVEFDKENRQLPNGDYIEAEGFDLTDCNNSSFIDCSIINSKSHYADSEHGSLICKNCTNISVDGCFSSGGHNEVFNFINCKDVRITNTVIDGGSGSAIATQGGSDIWIDNCISNGVGASGYSLNSIKVLIMNSTAKDWHIYNGITLGHPKEGTRTKDVVVSNCKMILSNNVDSHLKCALGGVIEGPVIIKDCEAKVSRICSFDGVYKTDDVSLTLENNKFDVFEGDSFAETFRAGGVLNLTVSNNTFIGNASITGYIRERAGIPASNWKIVGNTFKNMKQVVIIPPTVKENTSNGFFEFSNNTIERADVSSLRYYNGRQAVTNEFIAIPQYSKRIIANNKISGLTGGQVILFRAESSSGMETEFNGNYINSGNILDVLDLNYSHKNKDGTIISIQNNAFNKKACIKNAPDLIKYSNVTFDGNIKDGSDYNPR